MKKLNLLYLLLAFGILIVTGCTSTSDPSPDDSAVSAELKKVKKYAIKQGKNVAALEKRIKSLETELEKTQNNINDKLNSAHQSDSEIPSSITNNLVKSENKIKILEDRATYTDSLYFEILNDLVMIENRITSLTNSYKEMSELRTSGYINDTPSISDEEYREKYIEALSSYQNGDFTKSMDEFAFLIESDATHDLADNCQYWIGEVYYAMKDYKHAIKEFEKVFSFAGTNKDDDAQYKMGLCYLNIGNKQRAKDEFQRLLDYYPNSEYYQKSKNYTNQY
ncbi:MAG: tetratricopeptide repeat protein [Candidatus Marinimicrobia bacterium]|nr:tetratricopeptide repeat protein [Candidatus Neomarinimicrobiota bacterium]MBL7022631.1 tetratricopeptide repeat protein [Candidatus Neomarinimicrobiota bacterium]MBL7109626.1 tetratricopeptide repeat protein [Candidatus Neomarinimicrobiota bacterium]